MSTDSTDWTQIVIEEAFEEWSLSTTLDRASVRMYRRLARSLGRHGITRVGQLSRRTFCRFLDARIAEGRAPATVNNDTKALVALLKWVERRVEVPPAFLTQFTKLRVKEGAETKIKTFWSREEFVRLVPEAYAIAPWFGLAFELAVWTGARRTELRHEERSDYDLEARVLRLTRATKFKKHRVVSLCPQAIDLIRRRAPIEGPMFPALSPHARTPYVSDDMFVRSIAELERRTRIRCTWHKARRTFTTWAIQDGVPPTDVARFLGHQDLRILYKHYYVWIEQYAPSIEKLGRGWKSSARPIHGVDQSIGLARP